MANNDDLPDDFIPLTGDKLAEIGRTSWRVRYAQANPGAAPLKVGPKSWPQIITRVVADMATPIMANAVFFARAYLIRNTFGERLDRRLKEAGLQRKPATGSTGYVVPARVATGGAYVDKDTQILEPNTGQYFQVTVGKIYSRNEPIPVKSTSLGPASNLAASTLVKFVSPPAGVSEAATVWAQPDGYGSTVGLTGGRNAETDSECQERLIDRQANPPASGNSADIIDEVERMQGIPVEKAWVVPAIKGPGTTGVLFTVRPDPTTGSRIPNSVQLGQVAASLQSLFPTDYGIMLCHLTAIRFSLALRVTWKSGTKNWVDANPWPAIQADAAAWRMVMVMPTPAPTATSARVANFALDPVNQTLDYTIPTPVVGQTIATYDVASKSFKKKKIATVTVVTANEVWDLTFDSTSTFSDTNVPVAYQIVSPWSASLNLLPSAIVDVVNKLGPGEQVSAFLDPGLRQRRFPLSPEEWPSAITNVDLVGALKATSAVGDAVIDWPPMPYATLAGVPGVFSYLLQLGDLAISYQ